MEPHALVTEDHVKKALKSDKGKDAQLISWKIEDFTKKGDNLACFVTSIKVKFSLDGFQQDTCYIIKINPCRDIEMFDEVTRYLFTSEAGFYMNLVPELTSILEGAGQQPLRIPKYIYANIEEGKEIIILGDLRPLGFKMFGRQKGMDFAHATLVLKELARLHAASYLLQKKYLDQDLTKTKEFLKLDWLTFEGKLGEYFKNFLSTEFEKGIEMLKHIGGYEKTVNWLIKEKPYIMDTSKKMLQRTPPFDVVCHGDCWSNNILFRYDDKGNPVEVMLLDFQLNRYASLTLDLNYFLFTSLNGDVRQPNTETFFRIYFEKFNELVEAGGVSVPFTLQQLHQEYRNKHPFAVIQFLFVVPLTMADNNAVRDTDEVFSMKTKEGEEALKRISLELLDKNPLVCQRFTTFFDEMDKAGVFK